MKTHKRKIKQKNIRVAKRCSADIAIGKLEKGTDCFILTYGQFSLIDALMSVMAQTGPAHVVISTWTAAHAHLDRAAELLETANFLSFKMIVDRSFKTRQPKYFHHCIELFGCESIREINTHAKFIAIKNDEWNVAIKTSMNLNENPRLENLEITENKGLCEFFFSVADEVFREVKPNESKSELPLFDGIKETEQLTLLKGNAIKRENLNECKTTHTIAD